jgi:hypothetical protein
MIKLIIHFFGLDVCAAICSSVEVGFDARVSLDINVLIPSSSLPIAGTIPAKKSALFYTRNY